MPGYDAWKCDEPVEERELEAERLTYAAEQREDGRPLLYQLVWFFDWITHHFVVRFQKESPRGWWTVNESTGHTVSEALHNLREQRRAAR